ncbi:MAG: DUF3516 domain-containing protein [Acidobacteriota bacterium]
MSESPEAASTVQPLIERIPEGGERDPDQILEIFLSWVEDIGFSLYDAQEEALLEIMAGRHVILNTPTGSGKSLVAMGLHFRALCEGKRSYYTSPIKALASEKFFALCDDFGAENVGMMTGDASINSAAPIICCTAEVLSNMVLREGRNSDAPYVVMDEFHYYSDRERGVAWQIPLISLPTTRFLLMSATLGNTAKIEESLNAQTRYEAVTVRSYERPVPLDYEYRSTPLHETVQYLLGGKRAPIYIVNFTQRECAELAQSLTSMQIADREERQKIRAAMKGFRFDSTYGKDVRRFLSFGIGIHHAGLLPKYRRLVEQLSQQGLLKVICGTDTLGVGVNIPIRTVLFTKLCKFDGTKTDILSVRDFQQIAGRAGRKGFDDRGSVVAQAPEHEIENERQKQKLAAQGKLRKFRRKKPPERGFVNWDDKTFNRLIHSPPETLQSRFRLSHDMIFNLIQRDQDTDSLDDNFQSLRQIIAACHERPEVRQQLVSQAAVLVRSLHRAGMIKMVKDTRTAYRWVVVDESLQWDFSLFQNLSLYLVEAIDLLDAEDIGYALALLSLVEAILEDPRVVLRAQQSRARGLLVERLKAEGVGYEERMEKLEEVTHPKPNAEFIYSTFNAFRELHPWIRGDDVKPKGIGRELYEEYLSFADFVRRYRLQRSEGLVLRYLSQLYKTLAQSVPETGKTESVYDLLGFYRAMVERVDSSLLAEWESLMHPEMALSSTEERQSAQRRLKAYELIHDEKIFAARVRAEMHQLVRELARGNWEEAQHCVRPSEEDPWTAERFEQALLPFLAEYQQLIFDPEARQSHHTTIRSTGERTWEIFQTLVDPKEDHFWHVDATVDLTQPEALDGPIISLRRIGP